MKFKFFMNDLSNIKQENKLLKGVILILAITVVFSLYYTTKTANREKIILIPPQIHSKIVFIGNKPDKAYYNEITRYVVSLALDYTSATARSQFAELLTMFDPGAFKKYQQVFYNLAFRIESAGNISDSFYITKIKVHPEKKKIIVTGTEYTYSGAALLSQNMCRYAITYKLQAGRFFVTSFGKIKGVE